MTQLDRQSTTADATAQARTRRVVRSGPADLVLDPAAGGSAGHLSRATKAGAGSLVLAPVVLGAASIAQDRAIGAVDPDTDPAGFLDAVASHPGPWAVFGLLMLGGALLTAAWVPGVWRLATDRAPRWAWAAAVLGALFALGQMVHLMSWVALSPAMAEALDPDAALALASALQGQWFFVVVFAPYLLGAALAAPVAAVALRRARLLPVWAVVLVAAVSMAALVLGNVTMPMMLLHPLGLVVGLAPAVVRVLRTPSP